MTPANLSASDRTRTGIYSIVIAALLWSTGGVFIKSIELDAWSISLWRSFFAALTIYVIYVFQKQKIERGKREPWFSRQMWITAILFALLLVLFVVATKLTTSANAIFLQYTAPIYVLFAEPLMTGVKLKRRDLGMVAISTCAMALFFIGKISTEGLWGNIAALASGVAFAAFALSLKHAKASEALRWRAVIMGHMIIVVAMIVLVFAGITHPTPNTGTEFEMLLFLGVVQIGVAYSFFTFGIGKVRAIDATLISMIEPVLNPVWVFLGVGEKPGKWAILGGAIILGVVIARTYLTSQEPVTVQHQAAD